MSRLLLQTLLLLLLPQLQLHGEVKQKEQQ
jgi:hypothetical protein